MTPDDVLKAAKILERIKREAKSLVDAELANDHQYVSNDVGLGPVDSAEDRFTAAVKAAALIYWRERLAQSQAEVASYGFTVSDEDMEAGIRALRDKEQSNRATIEQARKTGVLNTALMN